MNSNSSDLTVTPDYQECRWETNLGFVFQHHSHFNTVHFNVPRSTLP